ncbi:MAG: argininosuccinate lyase, partial [Candidatus Methanofastidiosa archaeon]|nr:argininosuccinate lyase [Candidatus Methanofastidiosa archaeon]
MKLWEKDIPHDEDASDFSAAKDKVLDNLLLRYDCISSIAHAKGLHKIGILTDEERDSIVLSLEGLLEMINEGSFRLSEEDEDCHSAIERHLTEVLGDVGKKIHTCRSRNDQVLCALRLYYMDQMEETSHRAIALITSLHDLLERCGQVEFPGHTHTRKAMPTSVKDWAMGYIACLKDSISCMDFVVKMLRSNPLGTGAGYGLPIETDRKYVARELGLSSIDVNGTYSQLSRAKHEKMMMSVLSATMYDLNRMASDIIFFSHPDIGYFVLDKALTTGSSIMPQKANPDVLEIIRGYFSAVLGNEMQVSSVAHNLISGYHRDLQLSKSTVFDTLEILERSLMMMCKVIDSLGVSEEKCKEGLTEDVYLTEKAYELVKQGVPFRTAYR